MYSFPKGLTVTISATEEELDRIWPFYFCSKMLSTINVSDINNTLELNEFINR